MAHELTANLRGDSTVNRQNRGSVRAMLRLVEKRILRGYRYPRTNRKRPFNWRYNRWRGSERIGVRGGCLWHERTRPTSCAEGLQSPIC
ncbi:hypothetical protein [Crenobacter cavernae]|uniref:hypothetical protein n=1 Tax=Crenobacter cavernae TaxID=2290923 RepID=UPI003CCC52F4